MKEKPRGHHAERLSSNASRPVPLLQNNID
jgi:hypothetical protein